MARKPQKRDDKKVPDDTRIADMIDARDAAGLSAALSAADITPDWTDAAGRNLVHFAALWGDVAAIEDFVAKGVAPHGRDETAQRPETLARAMGHDAAAHRLASYPDAGAALGFDSLAALRKSGAENLSDAFHHAVMRGALAPLLDLARKEAALPSRLTAADLLGTGPDGDSTLLKICQQGALGKLLDVALWKERPEEFARLWAAVPKDYAAPHDGEGFIAAAQQAKLQSFDPPEFKLSRRGKPRGP